MFTAIFLLIIGTILILFNIKAIKKEKNNFQKIFHDKEENIGDYEIELGKLRKEFAETLVEIQSQVMGLEEIINDKNNKNIHNSTFDKELSNQNDGHNKVLDKDIENNDDKDKIGAKTEGDFQEAESNEENLEIRDSEKQEDNTTIKDEEIQKEEIEKSEELETPELNEKPKVNNVKVSEIQHLIGEGLGVDEIANKLKVSKGEVLLIKELYLK